MTVFGYTEICVSVPVSVWVSKGVSFVTGIRGSHDGNIDPPVIHCKGLRHQHLTNKEETRQFLNPHLTFPSSSPSLSLSLFFHLLLTLFLSSPSLCDLSSEFVFPPQ